MQAKKICVLLTLILFFGVTSAEYENSTAQTEFEQSQSIAMDDITNEWISIQNVKLISTKKIQKEIQSWLKQTTLPSVSGKKYQEVANQVVMNYQQKKSYSMEQPLFLVNPYGILEDSIYIYYESETPCNLNYVIYVDHDAIPPYRGTLRSNKESGGHSIQEGLLVGFVSGMKNYLTMFLMILSWQVITCTLQVPNIVLLV